MTSLEELPVELLAEIFGFLPALGDVHSLLLASPIFYDVFNEFQRSISLRVLSAEIKPCWNTACYVALFQEKAITQYLYSLDAQGALAVHPAPSRSPDLYTIAMQKRVIARARSGFARSMGMDSLSSSETSRFTAAFYTLWLYVLTPASSRPSLIASHSMPALLRAHDIARNLYRMQEKVQLSNFFGGDDTAWKSGLESFFVEWNECVERRLDDDGYFDPRVVECPLRAIQEPLLCWALLDEWQGYVQRVALREDVRAGRVRNRPAMVRMNSVGKGRAGLGPLLS